MALRGSRILQHPDSFHRHQRPTSDHLVQDGKQSIDMRLIVDNLDEDRQIRGQLEQARGVDHAAGTKASHATNHRRAGEPFCTQSIQQGSGEWRVMPLVGLPEEDADQKLITVEYSHWSPLRSVPQDIAGGDQSEPASGETAKDGDRKVDERGHRSALFEEPQRLVVKTRVRG